MSSRIDAGGLISNRILLQHRVSRVKAGERALELTSMAVNLHGVILI
jgi:hypothetical protein